MERGEGEEGICEKERREGSAVACFRLPTLLDAVDKATRFILRDGRCSMDILLFVLFVVVRRLRYCQGAQT